MDAKRDSNSDTVSSPENDNRQEKSSDDSAGVGRSYECTFCKRGFTNAQALGGHMNIHRKDKAKAAKHKNHHHQEEPSNVINIKSHENYGNSRYFSNHVSSIDHRQQTGYYRPAVGGQVDYQVYLPYSQNPSFQSSGDYNLGRVWRQENDDLDANLSLRIGLSSPPPVEDGEGGNGDENAKEDEVDLELRLGHDP